MRKTLTAEQATARDERRARFRELARRLSAMPEAERDALAAELATIKTIEGKTLSDHNRLLIASQMPAATLLGGFRQWLDAGRCVRKGEHGMMIWVPAGPRRAVGQLAQRGGAAGDDDQTSGRDGTTFLIGTIFDVSQTDELPMPESVA